MAQKYLNIASLGQNDYSKNIIIIITVDLFYILQHISHSFARKCVYNIRTIHAYVVIISYALYVCVYCNAYVCVLNVTYLALLLLLLHMMVMHDSKHNFFTSQLLLLLFYSRERASFEALKYICMCVVYIASYIYMHNGLVLSAFNILFIFGKFVIFHCVFIHF